MPAMVPSVLYEWIHGQCLTQLQKSKWKTTEIMQLLCGKQLGPGVDCDTKLASGAS